RHTRFKCDWSSDVCSSDLWSFPVERDEAEMLRLAGIIDDQDLPGHCAPGSTFLKLWMTFTLPSAWTWPRYMVSGAWRCLSILMEIGRASCREGVWMWAVDG